MSSKANICAMILGDNDGYVLKIKNTLKRINVLCSHHQTTESAKALLNAVSFDLIIIHELPDGEGWYNLITEAVNKNPNSFVYLITGNFVNTEINEKLRKAKFVSGIINLEEFESFANALN